MRSREQEQRQPGHDRAHALRATTEAHPSHAGRLPSGCRKQHFASGVTFAVAAGNESTAGQGSPARVKEAITVASSTKDDAQSEFSNFGQIVDIYAPGSDITSAWNDSDEGTKTISGTSMATPHVVGAAAVYLGAHQDATPEQVTTALTGGATADKITNPSEGTPNKLLKVVE